MKLSKIYNKIPTFNCKPGCSDCCGIAPFARREWARVADKRQAYGIKCPYVGEHGCDIYEQRPVICRIYGAVDELPCPHGCGPERRLTRAETYKLVTKIWKGDEVLP